MSANPNLNFGARTDHWGFATANLILQEDSKVPIPNNRADANNEYDDIVAFEHYGNRDAVVFDASVTYALKSGTLDLSTLYVGELSTGKVVESITVETTNSDWPKITVTGKIGMFAVQAPSGFQAKAPLPAFTIVGAKLAQTFDFTYAEGCRLTKSTVKADCSIPQLSDGLGEPAAYAIGMGTFELSADFVRVTAAPSWTLGEDWSEKQAPGLTEPQAGFHTSTGVAEMLMERPVAA